MALLHGKDGLLTFAGGDDPGTINVYEWELTEDRDIHDNTNFGSNTNARVFLGGMSQGTLRVRARVDSSQIPQLASMATAVTDEQGDITCDLAQSTPYNIVVKGLIEDINVVSSKPDVSTVELTIRTGTTAPTFDQA